MRLLIILVLIVIGLFMWWWIDMSQPPIRKGDAVVLRVPLSIADLEDPDLSRSVPLVVQAPDTNLVRTKRGI